jgi:hypothetical protein
MVSVDFLLHSEDLRRKIIEAIERGHSRLGPLASSV